MVLVRTACLLDGLTLESALEFRTGVRSTSTICFFCGGCWPYVVSRCAVLRERWRFAAAAVMLEYGFELTSLGRFERGARRDMAAGEGGIDTCAIERML